VCTPHWYVWRDGQLGHYKWYKELWAALSEHAQHEAPASLSTASLSFVPWIGKGGIRLSCVEQRVDVDVEAEVVLGHVRPAGVGQIACAHR
jgi:hypothetical protein